MMNIHDRNFVLSTFIGALIFSTSVHAQVAVSDEARDACVKDEMIVLTAKGAGLGVVAGLGAALFSSKKEDTLKKAVVGAAVGGAAGFATAYFTANDNCNKKNPNWIPESKIERTQDYEQAKKAAKYKSSEGVKVQATKMVMPNKASAGSEITMDSHFYVLTPKGEEVEVTIERKLFAILIDGKEEALPYNGHKLEQMTFQPGENKDTGRLAIPAKALPGTKYRYEFSVSVGAKPASMIQGAVTIE